jgi:beta-phosphoglucomutase-like phosphatase (HAD superfamily)
MPGPLIFDCDGTLADTMPAHYRAWQEILRPHGIPFAEERFYALGGTPTPVIARLLLDEARSTLDLAALVAAKEAAFLIQVAAITPIVPVVDVARAARGVVPIAVASGGRRPIVERTLRQIGILDWFPVVVTAEDTTRHKPDPDIFLEAARRLAVDPTTCTVYEDSDQGLEAARRAGMGAVDVRRL